MNPYLSLIILASILMVACDESASGIGNQPKPTDMGIFVTDVQTADDQFIVDAMVTPPPVIPDAEPVPVDATPQVATWIEVTLDPRRSIYSVSEPAQLVVIVRDRIGEPIPGISPLLAVTPEGAANIGEDGAVTFTQTGSGIITACVDTLCGETGFVSDDGPPVITVISPARGQTFSGPEEQNIAVTGTVTDLSPLLILRVNGQATALDEDGHFSTTITAAFGLNRVILEADDGFSIAVVSDTRDILWAPEYIQPSADGVEIESAGIMRLDQALFDTDAETMVPQMAAQVEVEGLAQLLEVFFGLIDITSFLDPAEFFGEQDNGVEILSAQLGPVDVDFWVTDSGLDLFLHFTNIEIQTGGSINLQGQEIGLDGVITISVAARVELLLGVGETFQVEVGDTSVVIESIDGDFVSRGLGALLTVGGGGISAAIEDAFSGVVDGIVRTQIAGFTRSALLGLFGDLRNLPLSLDPQLPGVDPLNLVLSLYPVQAQHRPSTWTRYPLAGRLTHSGPVEARENDPGVARLNDTPWSDIMGDGIGVGLRLSLFNALLHEVWRGGLLTLAPPVPEQLRALVEEVSIDAQLPPVIAPRIGPFEAPYELQLGELILNIRGPDGDALDEYRVSLRSGLIIRFLDGALNLVLDEVPDVIVQLTAANSENPLPVSLVAVAVQQIVWAQLSDALIGGLDFGLGTIDIDPEALAAYAPRIEAMTATPVFAAQPRIGRDQFLMQGNLVISLSIGDPIMPEGDQAPEGPQQP